MKTKSERFVDSKRSGWKTLLALLDKISQKGIKKLSTEEVEIFPRLYRNTCQDLAEARMLNLSPDVIEYLNNLTGQAHSHLYFIKPVTVRNLEQFFKKKLPFALIDNFKYVLLGMILFWGSYIGTYVAVSANPEFAEKFLSIDTLDYMEEMYEDSTSIGRSVGERSAMSAYYIQHNISIAFLCFATGIFFGLGSVYFLLYNGVFLGCIFGHLTSKGLGSNLWEFVTAHSFLELNAIAISGAAGFMLGISILKSWKAYSTECLKESQTNILYLVSAAAIMLFFAALIEGNISPSTLEYKYKVAIAIITIILTTFYFIVYPLYKGRKR